MEQVFTMLGYSNTLVSDNGPQFTSNDFEVYLLDYNIKHQLTSPYWAQANGEVERFNRTLTKTIKCAMAKGKDWKSTLQQFLLMYCTIPHTATGNLWHKYFSNIYQITVFQQLNQTKQKLIPKEPQTENKIKPILITKDQANIRNFTKGREY